MNLLTRFVKFITDRNLFSSKDQLLVAVSGGVDSVVLCELCCRAGYQFEMAHCNFQLRGKESERDENFVKELGEKYQVPVNIKKFETKKYSAENKLSIQEAARVLRYQWFEELATRQPLPSPFILTAHHADDNVETLLMNFFKGTGIAGLRGIPVKQGRIARPLLFARKEEIISFAGEHRLKWVEDLSNVSDQYTRNYFRNRVIPLVQEIYPEAINNLADNQQRFAEIEILYRQAIDFHKKKLLVIKGSEFHIPVMKLKKSVPLRTILYEIIQDFGFTAHQTNEVRALLDSESGKYVASSTFRILKYRNWLIISPKQPVAAGHIIIEEGAREVEWENGKLTIEFNEYAAGDPIPAVASIALLDAGKITFPLLLRRWKAGDYFYPLGMKKKKKLSRFLIDEKLPKTEKEKIRVLEMDKKILWVIGKRIDERFKITEKTKQVLKITWLPA